MAVTTPKPPKQPSISSRFINNFGTGLFSLAQTQAPPNSMVSANNVQIYYDKTIRPRDSLVEVYDGDYDGTGTPGGNIMSRPIAVTIRGTTYLFFVQDGKILFSNYDDDPNSVVACGGSNTFTSSARAMLHMVYGFIVITNGADPLAYVDTAQSGFPVIKFSPIDDPTSAPTMAATGFPTGTEFTTYYAVTFNSTVGETKASPIGNIQLSAARDTWKPDGSEFVTVTCPTPPTGAKSWNLYAATASNGGIIQPSDMQRLSAGLDIGQLKFADNGSIPLDISAPSAPTSNSTQGPVCKWSVVVLNQRLVLFGDVQNEYNIWIGGDGEYPLDLTESHNGYRAEVARGTGYEPRVISTFRTGIGEPVVRVNCINSENEPRYYELAPAALSAGDTTLKVWTITEQASGEASAISPWAIYPNKASLYFYAPYGFYTVGTKALIQNVLSTDRISTNIQSLVDTIRVDASDNICAQGFNDRIYWTVPIEGSFKNNAILTYDTLGDGMWYLDRLPADWLFVVDNHRELASMFIVQGARMLRFSQVNRASDVPSIAQASSLVAFPVSAIGAPIWGNPAGSMYDYLLQAVFTFLSGQGTLSMGISYIDRSGNQKVKSRDYVFSTFSPSYTGSWADPHDNWTGNAIPVLSILNSWSDVGDANGTALGFADVTKITRVKVPINSEFRQANWWIKGDNPLLNFVLVGVEYKVLTIGVGEDL